jgi:hypothetical protein
MFSSILQKAGFKPGLSMQSSIPRLLMAAAMVGGAGSLLSAGSAHAVSISICDFGGFAGGNTACTTAGFGSILDTGDKEVILRTLPTAGKGTINFQNLVQDFFTVRATFQPALEPPVTNATFEYNVNIISGLQTFKGVQLAVDAFAQTSVTKSELNTPARFDPLVITNSTSPQPPFPQLFEPMNFAGLTSLRVLDTYSLGATSGLTSFTNTFEQTPIPKVPGPLPVVGAGLALGFSRKLRGRIKASAAA